MPEREKSPHADELLFASQAIEPDCRQVTLAIPTIHCGNCVRKIEQNLAALEHVRNVRVNLSTKRVTVQWEGSQVPPVIEQLDILGHSPHILAAQTENEEKDAMLSALVRALAVAGFGASNIMILSVAVWAGVQDSTKDLFHWISAVIALPVLLFSGRIFFVSAWRVLRHGTTNMDVPISVGIILAYGLSLYDTMHKGPHAYFDASVMLIFFLLIGRTLDYMMREKARTAIKNLSRLINRTAILVEGEIHRSIPVEQIEPGMIILVAAGQRVPVDGEVINGESDVDSALVTGESALHSVARGSMLQAGVLNATGAIQVKARSDSKNSFLAEILRMVENAESSRSAYRRLADRAAQYYTPFVHCAAFLGFMGWVLLDGDVHHAVSIGIAVLIITCPCALGLAVPMVQVTAAKRLHEKGVLMKDGAALERLKDINAIVFDKTGTLTLGAPVLNNIGSIDADAFAVAARLVAHSTHPYSRAILSAGQAQPLSSLSFENIKEVPGCGIEASAGDDIFRLGRKQWALSSSGEQSDQSTACLSRNGEVLAIFTFSDILRPEAAALIARLKKQGFYLEIVSGDVPAVVRELAHALGIEHFQSQASPKDKIARLEALAANGKKVLMVGDGLNDVPALTAAHVSMAPANANDIGQQAADFVFLRDGLAAIPYTIAMAGKSHALIRQNFIFAILYNFLALPLAIAGFVTPLLAALAMSGSSIVVVANALRLSRGGA
ncbi:MAG: cadmium-translocating P-type ATPase [Alphaproteobacteria bacterium]|nr:cadmium-translocating P-type ATPase [Alphaproteobacteria bacterium]